MTTHRLINWLLALIIVGLYALVSHIDSPTDHSAEQAQATAFRTLSKVNRKVGFVERPR